MKNRPIPRKPLLTKMASGRLEPLYMGLQDEAVFSIYPILNWNEFAAFAAGAYEMKKSRPVRIEEMAVMQSIAQLVNTAHQQFMPDRTYALDSFNAAEQRLLDAGNKGSHLDHIHYVKLRSLNPFDPKTLQERLQAFDRERHLTVAAIFEQMKKAPKMPYVWDELDVAGRRAVLLNPEQHHQLSYCPETTRDRFRAYQTRDDFYAERISKIFEMRART